MIRFIADAADAPEWLMHFRAFSAMHAIVLLVIGVLVIGIIALGLRWRGTSRQRRFERTLGFIGAMIWIAANGYQLSPGVFDWRWSLPIHMCDLVALVAWWSMRRAARWRSAVLYFMGLGLCTEGFITPTLREGPGDPLFWCFWTGHAMIVIAAMYDLIVRRWRPTWRDWWTAVALGVAYLAGILALDIAFGWNYGFVGRDADGDAATIAQLLGPWPLRVTLIAGLSLAAFTALMLPWVVVGRPKRADASLD